MNNDHNVDAAKNVEATPAAPPLLVNGKFNKEYQRWYRSTPSGKECMRRWRKSQKGVASESRRLDRRRPSRVQQDQCRCLECGIVYDKTSAIIEGFKFLIGNHKGVCKSCQ